MRLKGVEKYSSAIVNVVDAPEIQLDENEQADNLLFLFYEALGWNRDDFLDPKKVRTTEEVYKQLIDRIKKQNPDSSSIGMFMVNAGPGIDEDIPSGKVVLLDGWVQAAQ